MAMVKYPLCGLLLARGLDLRTEGPKFRLCRREALAEIGAAVFAITLKFAEELLS